MKKQVAEIFYTENLITLIPDDLPKLASCLFQVVFFLWSRLAVDEKGLGSGLNLTSLLIELAVAET